MAMKGDRFRTNMSQDTLYMKMRRSSKFCPSPYEAMMKKYTEAHKPICRSVKVDGPREERPEKTFASGSRYKGTWDVLGMSGPSALYHFPNGSIYKGGFYDGLRHGDGQILFPGGEIIKGSYHYGNLIESTLIFADGLEYSDTDWMYCKTPDRRFTLEYETGVMPAGASFLTADLPTREIPPGYYDTGDGFYDPTTKAVFKNDLTSLIRSPSCAERKWIIENCRKSPMEQVGPRSDLYEEWLEPQDERPSPPLPFESNRSLASLYSDSSSVASIEDVKRWRRTIQPVENIQKCDRRKAHKSEGSSRLAEKYRALENPARFSLSTTGDITPPVRRQSPRVSAVKNTSTPVHIQRNLE